MSVWHMYRSMVGVGLLCGVLIVTVFQWTRPVIERNRAEALQQAIFQVLPAARSSATFVLDGRRFHAGYDDDDRLVGLALEASGMGYQDVIELLYGYSVERDAIVGVRVLASKETPGLGDRIENDPVFLANFEALDVSLDPDGSAVRNPIEFVKRGDKRHPWQIDGITGATISSAAIADILKRSTAFWVPRIRRDLERLRRAAPQEAS